MPTSAPGSERRRHPRRGPAARAAGFTLIELLIVIAIVALTTSLIAVSLRDSRLQTLEREADRLAMLLETARAESRATGLPWSWAPKSVATLSMGREGKSTSVSRT